VLTEFVLTTYGGLIVRVSGTSNHSVSFGLSFFRSFVPGHFNSSAPKLLSTRTQRSTSPRYSWLFNLVGDSHDPGDKCLLQVLDLCGSRTVAEQHGRT